MMILKIFQPKNIKPELEVKNLIKQKGEQCSPFHLYFIEVNQV